jgi:Bacterial protein of unknown function (DUF924)
LAKAFAFDAQALALSRSGIDAGFDLSLHPLERFFCKYAAGAFRSLADQDRCVSLFQQLVEQLYPDINLHFKSISTLPGGIEVSSLDSSAFRTGIKCLGECQQRRSCGFFSSRARHFDA